MSCMLLSNEGTEHSGSVAVVTSMQLTSRFSKDIFGESACPNPLPMPILQSLQLSPLLALPGYVAW